MVTKMESSNSNRDFHRAQPSGKNPRLPPRKPPKPEGFRALNQFEHQEQSAQIEKSGEDITFTKHDIIIAIMGVTGAGKSTFISLLSDAEIKIGHNLQSCTMQVGVYHFDHRGRRIFLVDTPGFDDTNRSDSEVLKDVAFWLAAAYQRKTQLAGIIYLHRISDPKMQGSALRNLRMFKELCGSKNLGSVILATTHWSNSDGVPVPESEAGPREKELQSTEEFWGGMIERGSQYIRHDGTRQSALNIISNIVDRRMRVTLDIAPQLIDQKRSLYDTDAGQALQAELIAERKMSEARLADLKLDMEMAIKEKDQKWMNQIEKEKEEHREEIRKSNAETLALKTNIEKIAKEKDEQYQKLQDDMKRQAEKHTAELNQHRQDIKTAQEENARKTEEFHRQRLEDERNHRIQLQQAESTIREESNQVLRKQLEQEQEAREELYQRQKLDMAEREEERLRQARRDALAAQRKDEQLREEIARLELETRKRSRWNPKRWFGEKYRDP